MKNQALIISSGLIDPVVDGILIKKDVELKELSRKNAMHFAQRNQPNAVGDNLESYTGEIKAGYEKLAAEVFQRLLPAIHFPEAKIDADYLKERDGNLDTEINDLEMQNQNDQYELDGFNPKHISNRMWWAILTTGIILIGEVIYNSRSFQLTGDNLLFALILSISVSVAVYVFAHVSTLLYKAAKTRMQRILVAVGSLVLILLVFIALAIFRSRYLAAHDVQVHPVYFVVINLFFFIVTALVSYFILPSWQEIKNNGGRLKKYFNIHKRKERIKKLMSEKVDIRVHIVESTKGRIRQTQYAKQIAQMVRKMYQESIGVFKTTNLSFRTDRKVPDCFITPLVDPDIDDSSLAFLNPTKK